MPSCTLYSPTPRRDQRGLCSAPRATGLGPASLLDHACSAPQSPRSSRAELSWFTAHVVASVCGSAVPLRSGSASQDTPFRRRSTSARRPQTEAVCTTRPLAAQAHLAFSPLGLDIGHPILSICNPTPCRRDQRALRSADRAIGRFPCFPSDHARSAALRARSSQALINSFTADAAASVCGSAASLRFGSIPLDASLRLRSTFRPPTRRPKPT